VPSIPRVSQGQAAWAIPIAGDDALPGDLVFFDNPVSHVALYLGHGRVIDASSAHGSVLIRDVWTSGDVSYGRVPRPTAPAVRVVRASRPVGLATQPRAPIRVKEDGRLNAVPPLGYVGRHQARPVAARFAALARRAIGAKYSARGRGPAYDAGGLVAATWRQAGGKALPATPAALELRTTRVRVRDVLPGDLVFYGSPAVHVGIYIGGGRMVDASRVLYRVVSRPVFRSDTVRFARIAPAARRVVAKPAKKSLKKSKKSVKKSVQKIVKKSAGKATPPRKTTGAKRGPKQPARPPVVKSAHPPRKR
jgi:cell wall-associated NlpC family hydrolase